MLDLPVAAAQGLRVTVLSDRRRDRDPRPLVDCSDVEQPQFHAPLPTMMEGSKPTMSQFSEALMKAIPRPCRGRPFVCEGSPEQCLVVVIGENPATELNVDWWEYWDESRGFLFDEWTAVYQQLRKRSGKAAVSPTRLRLNRLRDHGVKCLETNVFFNEKLGGPGRGTPNKDMLDLALSSLPALQFLIAHGRAAHKYLQEKGPLPSTILKVFCTKHFRLESYETIRLIAQEILATQQRRPQ